MKQKWFPLILVLVLTGTTARAQEKGSWRAASTTAESITGDIAFGDEKITIDLSTFPIAQIRLLTKAEAAAVFDADTKATGSGNLYRVSIPAGKTFLNKNTLCASEMTDWVVTYVTGRRLQLALFSGPKMPVMSAEALANTTSLCGIFSYSK
jgi:hypothetical protein